MKKSRCFTSRDFLFLMKLNTSKVYFTIIIFIVVVNFFAFTLSVNTLEIHSRCCVCAVKFHRAIISFAALILQRYCFPAKNIMHHNSCYSEFSCNRRCVYLPLQRTNALRTLVLFCFGWFYDVIGRLSNNLYSDITVNSPVHRQLFILH